MLMKKYAITILFFLLSALFAMWVDVRAGFPWNTIFINFMHSFFTGAEKWISWTLLALLILPDFYHAFKAPKSSTAGSASPTVSSTGSAGSTTPPVSSGSGSGSNCSVSSDSSANSDTAPASSSGSS